MKITKKDMYHGAALTQIVDFPDFKALNREDDKYGHYLINKDRRLLMKYSAADSDWHFTFSDDDIKTLRKDLRKKGKTFIALVCGNESVCLLAEDEFKDVFDPRADFTQSICVTFGYGEGMCVENRTLELKLPHKIRHNSFPGKIFE